MNPVPRFKDRLVVNTMQLPTSSSRRNSDSETKTTNLAASLWVLGGNIRRQRRAGRLTQGQLADHPKLLVTRQTVSRWETGQCMPERKHLYALAEIFGITADQLFGKSR